MTGGSGPSYQPPGHEPGPATLRVRQAVRDWLHDYPQFTTTSVERLLDSPPRIVCGCSGGADSFALVCALHHAGVAVHAVIVDHQLQSGSDVVAADTAAICHRLGIVATVLTVNPETSSEAAARQSRYEALGHYASDNNATVVVGHTRDDQAETFLTALARSSGTHSLAGMRPLTQDHPACRAGAAAVGRPILAVTRDDTQQSCHELGITPWHDPWNTSDEYLRVRVRQRVLPYLASELGSHIRDHCARSASLLAQDSDALDTIASQKLEAAVATVASDSSSASASPSSSSPASSSSLPPLLPITALSGEPPALVQRMIRQWLAPYTGEMVWRHYEQILALIFHWHGQGGVAVPWPKMKERPDHDPGVRLQVRRCGST